MNRRTLIGAVAASAALPLLNRVASAQTSPKTKNVVLGGGEAGDAHENPEHHHRRRPGDFPIMERNRA